MTGRVLAGRVLAGRVLAGRVLAFGPAVDSTSAAQSGPDHAGTNNSQSNH